MNEIYRNNDKDRLTKRSLNNQIGSKLNVDIKSNRNSNRDNNSNSKKKKK